MSSQYEIINYKLIQGKRHQVSFLPINYFWTISSLYEAVSISATNSNLVPPDFHIIFCQGDELCASVVCNFILVLFCIICPWFCVVILSSHQVFECGTLPSTSDRRSSWIVSQYVLNRKKKVTVEFNEKVPSNWQWVDSNCHSKHDGPSESPRLGNVTWQRWGIVHMWLSDFNFQLRH
jgi:hypothetical protein